MTTTRRVARRRFSVKTVAICAAAVFANAVVKIAVALPISWAALAVLGGAEFWTPQIGVSVGLLSLLADTGVKVKIE